MPFGRRTRPASLGGQPRTSAFQRPLSALRRYVSSNWRAMSRLKAAQSAQGEGFQYEDLTDDIVQYFHDIGKRACTCDVPGPAFIKYKRSRRTLGNQHPRETIRPKCPLCRKDFYVNMRGAFVALVVGGKGGGKSTLLLKMCEEISRLDPSRVWCFFQAPEDFINMLKDTDWCDLHQTTCDRALGFVPFDPAGSGINYYDRAGQLIGPAKPEFAKRGQARKICRCQAAGDPTVDRCLGCPYYRSFEDRVINVSTFAEVPYNCVFVLDEGVISANAKDALKRSMRQFGKFISVTQHKRIVLLVAAQEYGVIRSIRNQADMIIYKKIPGRMVVENARDPVIHDHADRLKRLQRWESLVVSSAQGFDDRFGIMQNAVPQFYDNDLSQSYAAVTEFLTENEAVRETYRAALTISLAIAETATVVLSHKNKKEAFSALRGFIKGFFGDRYNVTNNLVTSVMDFHFLRLLDSAAYFQVLQKYVPNYKTLRFPELEGLIPAMPESAAPPDINAYLGKAVGARAEALEAFDLWTELGGCLDPARRASIADRLRKLYPQKPDLTATLRKVGGGLRTHVAKLLREQNVEAGKEEEEVARRTGFSEIDLDNFKLFCIEAKMEAGGDSAPRTPAEKSQIARRVGAAYLKIARALASERAPDAPAAPAGDFPDLEASDAATAAPPVSSAQVGARRESAVQWHLAGQGNYVMKMSGSGGRRGASTLADLFVVTPGAAHLAQLKGFGQPAEGTLLSIGPLSCNNEIATHYQTLAGLTTGGNAPLCPHCRGRLDWHVRLDPPRLYFMPGDDVGLLHSIALEPAHNRKSFRFNTVTGEITVVGPNVSQITDPAILEFLADEGAVFYQPREPGGPPE